MVFFLDEGQWTMNKSTITNARYLVSVMLAAALILICTNCLAFEPIGKRAATLPSDSIDYYVSNNLRFENAVYKRDIKTVLLHPVGYELADPIIALGSEDRLLLEFDQLGDDADYYGYTLVHCTADWQPSNLGKFDYLDGFTESEINDYEFSFNTKQAYVHYRLELPNNDMNFTKSGNYLLKVYANGDEDDLVLTHRLVVYENLVQIKVNFVSPGMTRYLHSHQRLEFEVDYEEFDIPNPLADLRVNVLQNGRWDNAVTDLPPAFLRRNQVRYDYTDRLLFAGGNEFRFFDARNLSLKMQGVNDIEETPGGYELHLFPDKAQTSLPSNPLQRNDLNGKFLIGKQSRFLSNNDADYVYVNFYLPYDKPIKNGNVYVYGALSQWQTHPAFMMHYNTQLKAYTGRIYLKQGYYNYRYVIMRDGDSQPDAQTLEGSYFGAFNEYTILAYHRAFNARYDRVIGHALVSTFAR